MSFNPISGQTIKTEFNPVILLTKNETRPIFALLDCIYKLGQVLSSLKLDSVLSRSAALDETKEYTTKESWSYGLQSLTSGVKAAAMIFVGKDFMPMVQVFGEIPQHLLQGSISSFNAQKNLSDKTINEDTKYASTLEQLANSLKELSQRLIQTASLG